MNSLYYGDNLRILRDHISDESVDLVYLDPPFNSKATYNILYREKNGSESAAQIKAFEDFWHWDRVAEDTYRELVENGPKRVADLVLALRKFLGSNDMMAYIVMMAIRLLELHRVLKKTGSIYLHCDPTASHYLKIVMDSIFGVNNFRNEIIWHYRRWTAQAKKFQRLHDILLFYTKTSKYTFNVLLIPYTTGSVERKLQGVLHRFKRGEKPILVSDKRLQAKGVPDNDVWQIPFIAPSAKERLGYPTQKPEALLEKVIRSSSNKGDVVLDPFCGCGTAVAVAQKEKRQWIGIDITHLAIALIKHRLEDTFGDDAQYEVIGEPEDLKSAEALKNDDPYEFQRWALGLVNARPIDEKRGADRGIDGCIYFHDDRESTQTKSIIVQVKSGHVNPAQIRDLRGVIEREKAQIGVFITLDHPTRAMNKESVEAGYYISPAGQKYPKLQILTIEELLSKKRIDYPLGVRGKDATFRRPERHAEKESDQEDLFE
jgi:site-specific DNA-methyltransferase (adenine-specific)